MPETTASPWAQPTAVSGLDLAFPANVIGRLLPPMADIPPEFHRHEDPWVRSARAWFFGGVDLAKSTVVPKPGVDRGAALRHLQAVLGSFEPKHEHKEAGAGYLMSLWFERFDVVPAKGART